MLHGAAHWKATIHICCLKKFQKNLQIYYIHSSLPKNEKRRFDFCRTLGVNDFCKNGNTVVSSFYILFVKFQLNFPTQYQNLQFSVVAIKSSKID
jgi:hypothetical protein